MFKFKKTILLGIWSTLFLCPHIFGEEQENLITSLSKADANFVMLTKSIEENYKRLAQKKELLELKFYLYKIEKGDSLFTIAARLNLNYDSIATLNQLASPALIEYGNFILLPNLPAVYIYPESSEPLFKTTRDRMKDNNFSHFEIKSYIPRTNKDNLIEVYPNQKFSPQERLTFLTGFFLWPITGERIITSDYGRRLDPIAHQSYHQHNGIDLRLAMNSPVYASRMGKVKYVGYNNILGNYLILEHEQGFETVYGHLTKSIVNTGQYVRAGEQIAISGNSGLSTGPHLHFEIRKNGNPLDPKPFFVNN